MTDGKHQLEDDHDFEDASDRLHHEALARELQITREVFGHFQELAAWRVAVEIALQDKNWRVIQSAIDGWKLFPSRFLALWNTVQDCWACRRKIDSNFESMAIHDASVFWDWDHKANAIAINADCHLCRSEMLRAWNAAREFVQAGLENFQIADSKVFFVAHRHIERMLNEGKASGLRTDCKWQPFTREFVDNSFPGGRQPFNQLLDDLEFMFSQLAEKANADCTVPQTSDCLLPLPQMESRKPRYVVERTVNRPEIPVPIRPIDIAADVETASRNKPRERKPDWLHAPGEMPPEKFSHGTVAGTKTEMGAICRDPGVCGEKTLRNRIDQAMKPENAKFWIRETCGGEMEAFFSNERDFKNAQQWLEKYLTRKQVEANGS